MEFALVLPALATHTERSRSLSSCSQTQAPGAALQPTTEFIGEALALHAHVLFVFIHAVMRRADRDSTCAQNCRATSHCWLSET